MTEPINIHPKIAEILSVPPNFLQLAPELAAVPMMGAVAHHYTGGKGKRDEVAAEITAELQAFFSSLDRDGIKEALKASRNADGTLKLWDGRHRLLWAEQSGQKTVPVLVVTEAEGRAIVEASVLGRRHWTKGQRAYLAVRLHPEVTEGVQGGARGKIHSVKITVEELAARTGVSVGLLHQAVDLYRKFYAPGCKAKSPEAIEAAALREKYEMSIWAGAGLGAVIAGIGGGTSTDGKSRNPSSFKSLDKPLGTIATLSKSFTKWTAEERDKAVTLMVTRFREDLTPEFRLALSEALAAADGNL